MKPSALRALLEVTIPARLPVLIKGAPGVGKSDIVAQAASYCEADLLVSHPVVSDPTDYKGLPGVVDGQAEFLPFGDLRRLMEAERPTVAFLDDLGQAPAVVQAAAMQLILGRQVAGQKVSDQVVFIAATNRREDRAGVTGILEPIKSRFATIVELVPDLNDWCEWALGNEVPPVMVAFLRFRPDLLMDKEGPTTAIVNRPSPRTITFAAKLMSLGITDFETLAGAAGQGFATEFIGFLQVQRSMPNIDGILLCPDTATVPEEPSALFAVATALASRVTFDNANRIIEYASRMPEEFSVLCVRDCLRKCPGAAENRQFISWAAAHDEVLT